MGQQVEVVLNMDCWADVKKNPKRLVEAIDMGMHYPINERGRYEAYRRAELSGVQVAAYHHESHRILYVAEGYTMDDMSGVAWSNDVESMSDHQAKILADQVKFAERELREIKKQLKARAENLSKSAS